MATLHKLTLVPYLQRWDPATRTLSIRVLIVPAGNPLKPLVPLPAVAPAFADANLAFAVHISDTVAALPQRTLVDQMVALPDPAGGAATFSSPNARAIYTAIGDALEIPDSSAADTFAPQGRDMAKQVRKYLPLSYRRSFAFVKPRTSLAVIDDTYHCLMQCPPSPQPPIPDMVIGWGEAIAFALRQPRLAEALGLIFDLDVSLDAAPRLEHGGWLWVELAAASDYFALASTPGFFARVCHTRARAARRGRPPGVYAGRLPSLRERGRSCGARQLRQGFRGSGPLRRRLLEDRPRATAAHRGCAGRGRQRCAHRPRRGGSACLGRRGHPRRTEPRARQAARG